MQKVILTFFCLLFLLNNSFSQNYEVELGDFYKIGNDYFAEEHLKTNASGHYVYYTKQQPDLHKKYGAAIAKYDEDFNELWFKEFKMKDSRGEIFGIKSLKNNFALFTFDKFKKKHLSHVLRLIDENGEIQKEVELNSFKFIPYKKFPKVAWRVSSDSTKISVLIKEYDTKKKDPFTYNLIVLNSDLEILRSKKIVLPDAQKEAEILSQLVSDDGVHYMILKEYESKSPKERKKGTAAGAYIPAYKIGLYVMSEKDETPKRTELDFDEKFVTGVSLKTRDKEITCVGLLSDFKFYKFFSLKSFGESNTTTTGVFYLKLSEAGEIRQSSIMNFTEEQLTSVAKRKKKSNKIGTIGVRRKFEFGEHIKLGNGEIITTVEEHFAVRTASTLPGQSRQGKSYTEYYAKDLIIISILPEGEIKFIKVIPKNQKVINYPQFNSFLGLAMTDRVVYFYNDDIDNLSKPLDEVAKPISIGEGIVTAATIYSDGKIERKLVYKRDDSKVAFLPGTGNPISGGRIFFVGLKTSLFGSLKFKLGTIKLN